MTLHAGTIGGDVGGRYASLPVAALHCDGCEEVLVVPAPRGSLDAVYDKAWALGWALGDRKGERDLCPECAAATGRVP